MTVLSTLRDWVLAVTGYSEDNVVLAFGGGPVPISAYATIGRLNPRSVGTSFFTNRERVDGNCETEWTQPVVALVPINIYADNGGAMLARLGMSLGHFEYRNILNGGGVTVCAASGVRDLTSIGDVDVEPRFQRDFEVYYSQSLEETDPEVQIIAITGTVVDDKTGEQTVSVDTNLIE